MAYDEDLAHRVRRQLADDTGLSEKAMFEMSGRPKKGWNLLAPEALETEADLSAWVRCAVEFTRSPPKS